MKRSKKIGDETQAKMNYEVEWHHLARERRRRRQYEMILAAYEAQVAALDFDEAQL